MKFSIRNRIILTFVTGLVSGSISGFLLIGLEGNAGVAFPASLVLFPGYVLSPYVLLFLGPGLVFGTSLSLAASFGAGNVGRPVNVAVVLAPILRFTLASTAIWFLVYWIMAIPVQIGLRNLVLPGTIAGLVGAFLLSGAARVLPNTTGRPRRWITLAGALAGLLFFLNPGTEMEFSPYDQTYFQTLPWCISFALWQAIVGAVMVARLDTLEARHRNVEGPSDTLAAEVNRSLAPGTLAADALQRRPTSRDTGRARNVVTAGLFAAVLLAALLMSGITLSVFNRGPALTLTGHEYYVSQIVFSPDGSRLASASVDDTARIWDAATGEMLLTFTDHADAVEGIAFSPDGTRVATTSQDGTAKVWDSFTGDLVFTLIGNVDSASNQVGDPPAMHAVAFSPDGSHLAATSYEGVIFEWDAATGTQLLAFSSGYHRLPGIAYGPDGTLLVVASGFHSTAVWNAETGTKESIFDAQALTAEDAAFSPDNRRFATVDGIDAIVWDTANVRKLLTLTDSIWQGGDVIGVAFSPDGKRIATADGSAKVWDATTGRLLLTLKDGDNSVRDVAFSPDGTRLATANQLANASVWDIGP